MQKISRRSRSATSCCSRELGSRQILHVYDDRTLRANGSGAQWQGMSGQNWPLQNYPFHSGGTT
eukprot:3515442-Pleurochrysis_carterae.AAC.1